MTDTTTTLLRQNEAREAERETFRDMTHANVVAEWKHNPEDCARRALVDAGVTDENLLDALSQIATAQGGAIAAALMWYEIDQRMGEDDDS